MARCMDRCLKSVKGEDWASLALVLSQGLSGLSPKRCEWPRHQARFGVVEGQGWKGWGRVAGWAQNAEHQSKAAGSWRTKHFVFQE